MQEPNAVDKYIQWNAQTQLFEPVWWRRDILPFWLFPDEQFVNGSFTINAAGAPTPPVVYKLPHASLDMDAVVGNPLRITRLVFEDSTDTTALANFTVLMKDMGDQLQYMNAPIHIQTFAGTAQLPALLSEPLFLPTRHALMFTFNKIAGGAVTARLYPVGELYCTWSPNLQQHKLDHDIMLAWVNKLLERRNYVQPFWLTTDIGVVCIPAGNQLVEQDATIGDDAHFEGKDIMAVSDGAFEVEIINPITRQTLSNGYIHSEMLGTAQNPQPLPAGWIVPAGEVVRFRIRDLSGLPNNVYITIRGRKIKAQFKQIAEITKELGLPEPAKKVAK